MAGRSTNRLQLSCDVHTRTPARKVMQTSGCTILLYMCVTQTVLGMGTGMNVTAQQLATIRTSEPISAEILQGNHRASKCGC